MKRQNVIVQTALYLGIIVIVNLISANLYFRLDFTADKRYTLSEATEEILTNLEDVVNVKVYFSENLPPQLKTLRQDFEEQLIEYEDLSQGNIVYEFVNPNENQQTEAEAQQEGINPITVRVTEKDQVKQQRAYMGAVLEFGDNKEVIPMIEPGAGMEYALTTSVKKLSVENKPKIAFIQGHGEASVQSQVQLVRQLSVLYEIEPYTISDTADIPPHYQAIAIVDPNDTIPPAHFDKIDQYLNNSGALYLAYSHVGGNIQSGTLDVNPPIGITEWLAGKGIEVGSSFVIDTKCMPIGVSQRQGGFSFTSQVQFPYFPVAGNFANHPVSQGLESLMLPLVSTVSYSGDSSITEIPLVYTSEQSGLRPAPVMVDINYNWQESDFTESNLPLAMAFKKGENPFMVVVPNGNFAVNGEGQQAQQVNEDNVNFASNAIDWLSDDTGLIELRTKSVTSRPLIAVEDSTRNLLKYGNVGLPILIVLIYAFYRRQRYQMKQKRWLQGEYN